MIKKLFAISYILLSTGLVRAQSVDSVVYAAINTLRTQKIDTIIRFDPPDFTHNGIRADTLTGLGIVHPFAIYYLAYRSGGRTWTRKYEEYCSGDCDSVGLAVSKDYESPDDTPFLWLRSNLSAIKREEIFPYIYKQQWDGKVFYNKLEIDHPSLYLIGIYTHSDDIVKQFESVDFRRHLGGDPENLNFSGNNKTRLRVFYTMLEAYFARLNAKYIF